MPLGNRNGRVGWRAFTFFFGIRPRQMTEVCMNLYKGSTF